MSFSRVKLFFIIFYFSVIFFSFAQDKRYLFLSEVLNKLEVSINFDNETGLIELKKNSKSILMLLNSSYIKCSDEIIYLNDFVRFSNGEILLPYEFARLITDYFLFDKVSYKKDDFFYNSYVDDKQINEKANDKVVKQEDKKSVPDLSVNVNVKDRYIYDRENKSRINALIIDAGHGGHDPGAIGPTGVQEKDVTLKIALIVKKFLSEKYPDKQIVLTREKDEYISLEKRSQIANWVFNSYGPSIFLSIHTNASKSPKSYGFETWYLVEEYRRKIVKNGLVSTDADVENVLNSMLNDAIYNESKYLANKIQYYLNKRIGYVSLDRGIKEETYFVIKKSIMPAVLVEVGFISNKYEEIRLTKEQYLNNIAYAIVNGIADFIDLYEKNNGYTR